MNKTGDTIGLAIMEAGCKEKFKIETEIVL